MAVQDVPNPLVHRVTFNPGNETRKAKTKLDEVLEEKETRAALRFSAAEMEKMALESENEAARLRGEPPKYKHYGGEGMTDEERAKKEEEEARQREKLMASAKSLIDSGLDPKQVGQMLLGLPSISGAPPTPAQGMGFDEVMKMVTFIVGKKEADELKVIIASLDKKIDEMVKNPPHKDEPPKSIDPVTFAKQQAETLRLYHATLDEMGLIPKPEPRTSDGKSLDVVKEEHRHDERMDEIKSEREYKQELTKIAADIPERIGRGVGSQLTEGSSGSGGGGGGLEYLTCQEEGCGIKIYITPETGSQVECPKCGSIYSRKATVETQTS